MPLTKSAIKAQRQSIKRNTQNTITKKVMKSSEKSFRKQVATSPEEAQQSVASLYKAIDKSLKKGIIKKNTAARKKSRLMKSLNQVLESK